MPSGRLPAVLIPGYGVSSRYMVPLAERLAVERPAYAVDLPGHGRSEDPAQALAIPALAEVLLEWMDAAGLVKPVLIGNSMGCQIAVELALRHPDRADRLILISPTGDPEIQSFWQVLPRFFWTARAERLSLGLVVAWDYLRAGPRRLARELSYLFEDRMEDKLPLVTMPALVVRGERDSLVAQSWVEEVARRLGAGPVRILSRAGHAPNYSAPDELMRVIGPFLSRPSTGDRATAS
jgi:pimeloyl-ACP methyl ester carboxylesterase